MLIFRYMNTQELIALFQGEKEFFASMPDLKEVVLYGSALQEETLTDDVDLLIVPSREMSEGEKVDLRQKVWERFKDKFTVMVDVQVSTEELNKDLLASRGVKLHPVYTK